MADTFEKVVVKDDRIGLITDKVKYAILKGGQNVTSTSFPAISANASSHVYNIAVPSLETIISREVLWTSTVTLKITGSNRPNDQFLINYGVTDALAPFPLHQLVATMTANINNNTVAMNTQDVLPAILRLCDPEELAHYNDFTPTTLDYLGDYRDGVDLMDFQIGRSSAGNRLVTLLPGQNFATPAAFDGTNAGTIAASFVGTAPRSYISYPNNVLAFDQNRLAGSSKAHRPRGSFRLMGMWASDGAGGKRIPQVDDNEVYVQFKVTEPLLLSPFTFGSQEGKQGFYGVANMNIQMNMQSNANRAWRSVKFANDGTAGTTANTFYTKTASIHSFEESRLVFTFITPHASQALESRNVVPYYELPVYRTTNFEELPARAVTPAGTGGWRLQENGTFEKPPTKTLQSSNIQLNGIPDKLIIFVRKTNGSLTCCDADNYLTIENIRINFNNQAGLLSSMTPEQLYANSVLSGLARGTQNLNVLLCLLVVEVIN